MKKIILSFVLVLLSNITVVSAFEPKPKKSYVNTTHQLSALLKPTSEVVDYDLDVFVRVKVFLNVNREIVVLGTSSDNTELNNYIKEKLNYKKIHTDELAIGNGYEFDINFKSI